MGEWGKSAATEDPFNLFTCSPIHLLTCSPVHLFTYSPIHPFTHSPIHVSRSTYSRFTYSRSIPPLHPARHRAESARGSHIIGRERAPGSGARPGSSANRTGNRHRAVPSLFAQRTKA